MLEIKFKAEYFKVQFNSSIRDQVQSLNILKVQFHSSMLEIKFIAEYFKVQSSMLEIKLISECLKLDQQLNVRDQIKS